MGTRFRRPLATAALVCLCALVCGVAGAAAQNVPVVVGAIHNSGTGSFEDALSGTVAVATQDTAQGWFAYTPAYYNGELTAISMANPAAPVITGAVAPLESGTQLYGASTINISNGIAYVVSKNLNGPCPGAPGNLTGCSNNYSPSGAQYGNALSLFDVATNPAVPRFLGSISDASTGGNTLFGAYGVAVTTIGSRTYAVVAAQGCISGQPCPAGSGGDDLDVINVQNPAHPYVAGTASDSPSGFPNDLLHATAVAVSGSYAYVTADYGSAFTVVDISNPSAPTAVAELRSSQDFPAPTDVAVEGNYAYVINQNSAGGQGTLSVVDISTPSRPVVVGSVTAVGLEAGYRIRVSGNTAWVASHGTSAITTVDITNPADPTVTASTVSTGDLTSVSGLDLMSVSGNQYVIGSSPRLPADLSYTYPPYPSFGNTVQTSTGTISALELEATPVNTAPPTVTGTALAGRTLKARNGSWTGTSPLSYGYQWQRCDAHGANCSILKTSTQTYPLGLNDIGHTLRVVVKAVNAAGSLKVTSATSPVVRVCPANGRRPGYCAKPKVLARPTVTGTTMVGQLLVTNPGRWSKLPPSPYGGAQVPKTKARWLRCNAHGARCRAIAHATRMTYTPTSRDLNRRLRLQVIATNRNGSTAVMSAPSAPIVAAGTRVRLVVDAAAQQPLIGDGYVLASIQSNVGALVDVFFAVKVGQGPASWTTATPTQAAPGRAVKFKLVLKASERRRLRRALAAHQPLTAFVIGSSPGHPGIEDTEQQPITITG